MKAQFHAARRERSRGSLLGRALFRARSPEGCTEHHEGDRSRSSSRTRPLNASGPHHHRACPGGAASWLAWVGRPHDQRTPIGEDAARPSVPNRQRSCLEARCRSRNPKFSGSQPRRGRRVLRRHPNRSRKREGLCGRCLVLVCGAKQPRFKAFYKLTACPRTTPSGPMAG